MAYNEEANIVETLNVILEGNRDIEPILKVYANGCTDNTHQLVREMSSHHPSIELIKIEQASKANAWNTAFNENQIEILLFADGDIKPDHGAITKVLQAFDNHSELELVCCESWPDSRGLNWQQKLTGFIQIPLQQDFLIGHFYGIRRSAFVSHFQQ